MKTLLINIAAAIALAAAPAFAQDHAAHHPQGATPAAKSAAEPMDMANMTPEQMHRHCAAMMGGEMQGAPKHDHSADKLGHAPARKAPTEAEMKAMHDKCAAMMAEHRPPATPEAK